MKQDTLKNRIYDGKQLTESEIESLVELLGKRCQARTINALRRSLKDITTIGLYGIYGRVVFTDGQSRYDAGQSYPDEIRTVRQLIIKN
jgi:hypothetical protein